MKTSIKNKKSREDWIAEHKTKKLVLLKQSVEKQNELIDWQVYEGKKYYKYRSGLNGVITHILNAPNVPKFLQKHNAWNICKAYFTQILNEKDFEKNGLTNLGVLKITSVNKVNKTLYNSIEKNYTDFIAKNYG